MKEAEGEQNIEVIQQGTYFAGSHSSKTDIKTSYCIAEGEISPKKKKSGKN